MRNGKFSLGLEQLASIGDSFGNHVHQMATLVSMVLKLIRVRLYCLSWKRQILFRTLEKEKKGLQKRKRGALQRNHSQFGKKSFLFRHVSFLYEKEKNICHGVDTFLRKKG